MDQCGSKKLITIGKMHPTLWTNVQKWFIADDFLPKTIETDGQLMIRAQQHQMSQKAFWKFEMVTEL